MDFERLDASGKNAQKGSKVLKVIHDKTFILDLFVRESIQNSLDAYDNNSDGVLVEYIIGDFVCDSLAKELVGLNESFYKKYKSRRSQHIAIRDSHTTGLTGCFHRTESSELGNLYKLVFDTFESKGDGESGGSWGLGKTMYSLLGVGIVLYYSRIKTENGYESRLVGALIENEKKTDHISQGSNIERSGIGWWGTYAPNSTSEIIPITNEGKINSFLEIFNIKPFLQEETGTCVIIPYVDLENLLQIERERLQRNEKEDVDSMIEEGNRPWLYNIIHYLSVSTLRWYFPRIDNSFFKYGPKLSVTITDTIKQETETISPTNDYRLFRILQALYNRAVFDGDLPCYYDDIFSNREDLSLEVKPVNFTQRRLKAGSIASVRISSRDLIGPHPSMLLGMSEKCGSMIGYTRSLGMIVWYENANLDYAIKNDDEWILAQFVLNGAERLDNYPESENTLEKYIRKTEGASHNSWTVESGNFAANIKRNIKSKLKETFPDYKPEGDKQGNPLARELGTLLTPEKIARKTSSRTVKARSFSSSVNVKEFSPFTIEIDFEVNSKCEDDIIIELQIASESGAISLEQWTSEIASNVPFSILSATISPNSREDVSLNETTVSGSNSFLFCELDETRDGYFARLRIKPIWCDKLLRIKSKAAIVLEINNNKYIPSFNIHTEKREN